MTNLDSIQPTTINKLRDGADASFAMLAGILLDIFTPLKDGPMTTEQIADALEISPRRLHMLLYGLVYARLLTEKDGLFSNTDETNKFLVKDSDSYIGGLYMMLRGQWGAKLKTAESIRADTPQAMVDFSSSPPEVLENFYRGSYARAQETGRRLAGMFDFSSVGTLVDIGGGSGGLSISITKAFPHIEATIVDLPLVTPITQKIVDEEGASSRVTVETVDVINEDFTGSFDVAIVRAVVQVLSSENASRLLKNVGEIVKPGGQLLLIGQILDDSRISPPVAVGFNLGFINNYAEGEVYTYGEHRDWLTESGFVDIERSVAALPADYDLITARKPS